MGKRKARVAIPPDVAAKVLFLSDRTCCVCRQRGKPVQIHHIDEAPANNSLQNLAVLCFDCHRDTQITGGFDRKLDSEQIILYCVDWQYLVKRRRAALDVRAEELVHRNTDQVALVTSLAEIYRENEEYQLLASYYNALGNTDLRDKYAELAITKSPTDQTICSMRILQSRPELIPPEVIDREVARYSQHNSPSQRARFYCGLGRYVEAAQDYVSSVQKNLDEGRFFPAAFYLKELFNEGLVEELFQLALTQATDEADLWWQVRALQELGWQSELEERLLNHEKAIVESGDYTLNILLARAKGDDDTAHHFEKQKARGTRMIIWTGEEPDGEEEQDAGEPETK